MTTAAETRDKTLPKLDETDFPDNAKRMMRAGIHLFAENGFAGTSVREIVQAADVTNPMLYYYFDDKKGLYNTLLTYLFDFIADRVGQRIRETDSLVGAVDATILAHFEGCRQSPVALRFIYSVLFGPEEVAPDLDLLEKRQQMTRRLSQMFVRAAERGDFEPGADFEPLFLTDMLLEMINQRLMRALQELHRHSDPETGRRQLHELTSPQSARRLRRFFFSGAGRLTDPSSSM